MNAQPIHLGKIDIGENRDLDQKHVESLKASIEEIGLLQPVVVTAEKGGRYRLRAGHHRLAALTLMGATDIPAVVIDGSGDVASAVENIVRKQLSLSDRIALVERRAEETDAALAAALGVAARKVKQIRQLATLPQEVIVTVDAEKIPAAVASYLSMAPKTVLNDLIRELKNGNVPWWAQNVDAYRNNQGSRRISTDVAPFDVGASGLGVDIDLFQESGGWFQDTKAFFLQQKKAADEIGRSISGDVRIGVNQPPEGWWDATDLRKSRSVKKLLNEAAFFAVEPLYSERDEINAKLKALKGKYDQALSDRNDDVLYQIARIENDPRSYSKSALPKDVKVLGYIKGDGFVDFKLYVAKKAEAPTTRTSAAAPAKPLEPHTKKAWRIARDHRALQVQAALVADPLFALRVTLASMLSSEATFGHILTRDHIQSDVPSHAESAKKIMRRVARISFAEAWARVAEMPLDVVAAEYARLVASAACVTGHRSDITREDRDDGIWRVVLGAAQAIVPATPLPPEYFEAHQTAQLLKLLKTIAGAKEAKLYEGKPKKKVAEAVRAAAIDTGWLPVVLEFEKKASKPKAERKPKAKVKEVA